MGLLPVLSFPVLFYPSFSLICTLYRQNDSLETRDSTFATAMKQRGEKEQEEKRVLRCCCCITTWFLLLLTGFQMMFWLADIEDQAASRT